MEMELFRNELLKKVKEVCQVQEITAKVSLVHTNKVNTIIESLQVVLMDKNGELSKVGLGFDLKALYNSFCTQRDLTKIAEEVVAQALKESYSGSVILKMRQLEDKEWMLGRVRPVLVNREWNRHLMSSLVYMEFLDLLVVFQIILDKTDGVDMSLYLTNDVAKMCGITLDDLKARVLPENVLKGRYKTDTMRSTLERLQAQTEMVCDIGVLELGRDTFVVSTPEGMYGAGALLCTSIFKDIAQVCNSDLYICPSSIHECIILPVATCLCLAEEYLRDMITSINLSEVDERERLSNNLYRYSREKNAIEIA